MSDKLKGVEAMRSTQVRATPEEKVLLAVIRNLGLDVKTITHYALNLGGDRKNPIESTKHMFYNETKEEIIGAEADKSKGDNN